MCDSEKNYLIDLLGGLMVIVIPMITAIVAIYQKMPWPMPMRHLLTALTVISGSAAIVLKVRNVNSIKRDHEELMNVFDQSRMQMDECNRLMRRLVAERRRNLALLTENEEEFSRRFVAAVAQVSSQYGLKYMEYLNYERALVFKWWNDDARERLVSLVRILKKELGQMEITYQNNVALAAKDWLLETVLINDKGRGDEFSAEWEDNIKIAYDTIVPIAVEGFDFSPKVYLHRDKKSMELYCRRKSNISGRNIGEAVNDGKTVTSFMVEEKDLLSLVGLGRLGMACYVSKILGSAGFVPVMT